MKHRRQALAQPTPQLSLRRKAALLAVHRSGVYYRAKPAQDDQVEVMNQLRDLYQQYPFMWAIEGFIYCFGNEAIKSMVNVYSA
ncbi:MAG: hypothetical protein ROO73_05285 [Roseivirga sp.]